MRNTLVSIVGNYGGLHDKFDDKEHVIGRVEGLTDAIKYDSATGGRGAGRGSRGEIR